MNRETYNEAMRILTELKVLVDKAIAQCEELKAQEEYDNLVEIYNHGLEIQEKYTKCYINTPHEFPVIS
jgi:hypothetical protein